MSECVDLEAGHSDGETFATSEHTTSPSPQRMPQWTQWEEFPMHINSYLHKQMPTVKTFGHPKQWESKTCHQVLHCHHTPDANANPQVVMETGLTLLINTVGHQFQTISRGSLKTIAKDMKSPEKAKRRHAMQEEYESMLENNTWAMCPLLAGRSLIRNKWIFKLKYNLQGNVDRYKARLVARGFTTSRH